MRTFVGIDALEAPAGGASVAIGTFDGVHLGHRTLIARARLEAARTGAAAGVVTWDRHPAETVRPDRVPPRISSQERKVELLSGQGIELLAVLPFDDAFSQITAEDFVAKVLHGRLDARVVVVGQGWRFGHGAAGDVGLLRKLGGELGFEVVEAELVEVDGEPVSSGRIRRAIADGDVLRAALLLGRPFDMDARVVHGDGRGHSLGFPTANLDVDPRTARPAVGVYAGRAHVGGSTYGAAISVGVNPTFGGTDSSPVRIEAYLLDFDGDLYGRSLRLELWDRLRDELRFDSVDDLVAQMHLDVGHTREVLAQGAVPLDPGTAG